MSSQAQGFFAALIKKGLPCTCEAPTASTFLIDIHRSSFVQSVPDPAEGRKRGIDNWWHRQLQVQGRPHIRNFVFQ